MAAKQDFSRSPLNASGANAKHEVDTFVGEESLVAQHEAFFRREFGQKVLRQRRPLIWQPRFIRYHGDRFGVAGIACGECALDAGIGSADDDKSSHDCTSGMWRVSVSIGNGGLS